MPQLLLSPHSTMDVHPDTPDAIDTLPYDEPIKAEDEGSASASLLEPAEGRSLADRIGHTKVYLLSDASKSRGGKVRGQYVCTS